MSTVLRLTRRPFVSSAELYVKPSIAEDTPPIVVAMLHHDKNVRSLAANTQPCQIYSTMLRDSRTYVMVHTSNVVNTHCTSCDASPVCLPKYDFGSTRMGTFLGSCSSAP
eukprot:jgi/Chrzof1/7170/Cz02g13200.t1